MLFKKLVGAFCHWLATDVPNLFTTQLHDPSTFGSSKSVISENLPGHDFKNFHQQPFSESMGLDPLCNGPGSRQKWCTDKRGKSFDINTDYESSIPDTGRTNHFTLVLTNGGCSPDGYKAPCVLINGTYPGPLIHGNWGDFFNITVINKLNNCNGTAIHFHGLRQWNTPWSDGVPGITQCPIPPRGKMSYIWRATQYGASWYHSHFSLQYTDGVLGPMIIYGPTSANYDEEGGPILLTDWYHQDAFSLFWKEKTPGVIRGSPEPDAFLINGRGNYTAIKNGTITAGCSTTDPNCVLTQASKYITQPLKNKSSYKFRIINTSADTHLTFWIDGHDFTVVGTDYVAVQPYKAASLNVAIGQRYDIIVHTVADISKSRQFWIKMRPCTSYCVEDSHHPVNATLAVCRQGILRYAVSGQDDPDANDKGDAKDHQCRDASMPENPNDPVPSPIVPRKVDGIPEELDLDSALRQNNPKWNITDDHELLVSLNITEKLQRWILFNSTFDIDWRNPTLGVVAKNPDAHLPRPYNPIYLEGKDNDWQIFVIEGNYSRNIAPLHAIPVGHPIHLHGHDFVILHQSTGDIKPNRLYKMNVNNPTRRDVAMLPKDGFLIIAFRTDNPGPWLMHCHIAWHASGGLALQFVERKDDIPGLVDKSGILPDFTQRCYNWDRVYRRTKNFCPRLYGPAAQDDSGI